MSDHLDSNHIGSPTTASLAQTQERQQILLNRLQNVQQIQQYRQFAAMNEIEKSQSLFRDYSINFFTLPFVCMVITFIICWKLQPRICMKNDSLTLSTSSSFDQYNWINVACIVGVVGLLTILFPLLIRFVSRRNLQSQLMLL